MRIAAAVSSRFLGLGFGIPGMLGMVHLNRTGEVWTFVRFPTYGGGPLERVGLPTTMWLMAGFLAVCIAEVIVGLLIWLSAPYATVLSFLLLTFELVYWIGFALPVGPLLGAARTVFVLLT